MVRNVLIAAALVLAAGMPSMGQEGPVVEKKVVVMGPSGQDLPAELQAKLAEIEDWLQSQDPEALMAMFGGGSEDLLCFPEWGGEFLFEIDGLFEGECMELEGDE